MKRSKRVLLFLMVFCIFVCGCQKNIDDTPINNITDTDQSETNDDNEINNSIVNDNIDGKYNDIVVTTDALNFREGPSTDDAVIKTFYKNEELQVINRSSDDDWLLVNNNNVSGYVSSEYTVSVYDKLKEAYPDTKLNSIDVKKVVYATDNLNIRSMPGTEYGIVETINKFVSIRVLDEIDDWYFVMTNEYTFGYVSKQYTEELNGVYVIVDKSVQRLFLYNDNKLKISTVVTTGKDSTPSDTGKFQIYSKETSRYLIGADYKAWVDYWMPYNGGEGLHDANWHNIFGTESYKIYGSHGCVNLLPAIAGDIYNNVSVGTTVLVHK